MTMNAQQRLWGLPVNPQFYSDPPHVCIVRGHWVCVGRETIRTGGTARQAYALGSGRSAAV
ncbi:protein of unknown function [Cupriavidus taiwanensis]|nr:protein of unknown function [Cupriavidus taiwanensis]